MKVALIVVGAVLAIVIVGIVILGGMDIPGPTGQVEKTIPAEKLAH